MTARRFVCLPGPMDPELARSVERIAATTDVEHVAVLPDAHVAHDVCVGTVTATTRRLLPAAVGGDLGCGMSAVRLGAGADRLADPSVAGRVLEGLYRSVPTSLHASAVAPPLPPELAELPLDGPLEKLKRRDGRLQCGTLGRGNHFLELQRDEEGALWWLVHSGSRAMGPAIREHHERGAAADPSGLRWLEAGSPAGRAYLAAVEWARAYARISRARMLAAASDVLADVLGAEAEAETWLDVDHNHVRLELHGERALWVHRKGAMGLERDEPGVVPGSMGSASFHVQGRGHAASLRSCAHGAGRALSRAAARRRVDAPRLLRETEGIWFDHRLAERLREEAPSAYKDVGTVMRAQRDLVRVVRRLVPVLVYKAG